MPDLQAENLATIEGMLERCNAATDGPWELLDNRVIKDRAIGVGEITIEEHNGVWSCDDPLDGCDELAAEWYRDLTHIAHARTDLPRVCEALKVAIGTAHAAMATSIGEIYDPESDLQQSKVIMRAFNADIHAILHGETDESEKRDA